MQRQGQLSVWRLQETTKSAPSLLDLPRPHGANSVIVVGRLHHDSMIPYNGPFFGTLKKYVEKSLPIW